MVAKYIAEVNKRSSPADWRESMSVVFIDLSDFLDLAIPHLQANK